MIYVDELRKYPTLMTASLPSDTWCHLWSDSDDLEELHQFAEKIGMRRSWFQNKKLFPHYDLVPRKRALAIKLGAVQKPLKQYLQERMYEKS